MDIKALMDELLEHGCILQSREALAQGIIEKHAALPVISFTGKMIASDVERDFSLPAEDADASS